MNQRRIAIMQPYLFPYIGYFQLISAVDLFVFLNDVTYQKSGWINRNRILVSGQPFNFAVPVCDPSQNRRIDQTLVDSSTYSRWRTKFFRTIQRSYSKAPYYQSTLSVLRNTFDRLPGSIDELAQASIRSTCALLDLQTPVFESAYRYAELDHAGAERLLAICAAEGASHYLNAPGGRSLYDRDQFADAGVQLVFLEPEIAEYNQGRNQEFTPRLSIIDVLMFNSAEEIRQMLTQFDLT